MEIVAKALMFCILLTPEKTKWDMDAQVVSMHDAISTCHVALTTHGFDNPNDICFCTSVTDNANESQ